MPDGQPLSSVLSFYFRDEVLPYYAGDDEAARDLAANDFKYWELMRRACARGLQGLRLRPQQAGHRLVRVQEELGLRADAAALRVLPLQARARCRRTTRSTRSTGADRDLAADAARRGQLARAVRGAQPRADGPAWPEPALPGAPHAVPAEQGRQGALVPPAQAPGRRAPGLRRHLRRRPATTRCTSTRCARCAPDCTSTRSAPARARVGSLGRAARRRSPHAALLPRRRRLHRWVRDVVAASASTPRSCSRRRWRSTRDLPGPADAGRLRRRGLGQVDRVRRARTAGRCRGSTGAKASGCSPTSATSPRVRGQPSSSPRRKPRCSAAWRPRCAGPRRRDRATASTASTSRPTRVRVAVRARRAADGLHRRHGLLAQRRRRHLVRRARCCRRSDSAMDRAALPHRRPKPGAGGARAGRRRRRRRDGHRARRAPLSAACRASWWRRCGWRAASRTRSSKPWRWAAGRRGARRLRRADGAARASNSKSRPTRGVRGEGRCAAGSERAVPMGRHRAQRACSSLRVAASSCSSTTCSDATARFGIDLARAARRSAPALAAMNR